MLYFSALTKILAKIVTLRVWHILDGPIYTETPNFAFHIGFSYRHVAPNVVRDTRHKINAALQDKSKCLDRISSTNQRTTDLKRTRPRNIEPHTQTLWTFSALHLTGTI